MTDEKSPAERLNNLEERMGRLEVRMDAVVKQMELLRSDLDGHFDRLIKLLEERLIAIEERLPPPPPEKTHDPDA